MKIKVLGPGCPSCTRLYQETRRAVAKTGLQAELARVEQVPDIMAYGMVLTPALVVDEEIKSVGKALNSTEIARILLAS